MNPVARWVVGLLAGAVLAAVLFAPREVAFVVIGAAATIGFSYLGFAARR